MSKDQLQINPQAFQEAIRANAEVKNLLSGLPVNSCRAADIIDFYQRDTPAFIKAYPNLVRDTGVPWPKAPIAMVGDHYFGLAHEIAENFTIVCLPSEKALRSLKTRDFRQGDPLSPTVALRVGHLAEDEIIITGTGELLVRRDVQTTRRLTSAEIKGHALEIEKAIEAPRFRKLATAVKESQERHVHWSEFEKQKAAPCERITVKQVQNEVQAPAQVVAVVVDGVSVVPQTETEPRDLDIRYQRLTQTMQDLEEIAKGRDSSDFPKLIAAYGGKTITREQAVQLSQQIKSQLGVDLLQSTDRFEELLVLSDQGELAASLHKMVAEARSMMDLFKSAGKIGVSQATITFEQLSADLGTSLLEPTREWTKILVQAGLEKEANEIWAPIFENVSRVSGIKLL